MRPYGRAKFFRDCARFGFLNEKMHNLPLFYLFGSLFKKICCFLALFVCAKLLNRNIGRAKQIVFRKSAHKQFVFLRIILQDRLLTFSQLWSKYWGKLCADIFRDTLQRCRRYAAPGGRKVRIEKKWKTSHFYHPKPHPTTPAAYVSYINVFIPK